MLTPETPLLTLLAGAALLLVGRRLFWLFVGLTGFFTVYRWFEPYSTLAPSMRWVLAILVSWGSCWRSSFRSLPWRWPGSSPGDGSPSSSWAFSCPMPGAPTW